MSVIDDYLTNRSPAEREALERIRMIVKRMVPDVSETIGYGMPVLKYKGKYLIGFCAFKDHLSVFPGAEAIARNEDLLKDFKTAKGTVQFTLSTQISEEIITALVKTRIAEIDHIH